MANHRAAFEKMIDNEGGFKLHKVKGDTGGWTFAGIAENYWPDWKGWPLVKSGREEEATPLVEEFYKINFWDKISGDKIENQSIAYDIYDFSVNAYWKTAARLAQRVIGAIPDGKIGPKTLEKLNAISEEDFEAKFALAKITRYVGIVNRNRSQGKFLLGWLNRTLKVLAQ